MTIKIHQPVLGLTLCAALLAVPLPSFADLVYYAPFENSEGQASLANAGTVSGNLTGVTGPYGGTAPGAPTSANFAPNLGSAYSELFAQAGSSTSAGALLLPNSTDRFRLDSSGESMTLSTWVYWNGSKADQNVNYTSYGIANTYVANTGGWQLNITKDGELNFGYRNSAGGSNRKTAANTIVAGGWYNVVMTWDTTSNYALTFYVNGVKIDNSTITNGGYTGSGVLVPSTTSVALGAANNVSGNGSNGGGYGSLNGYLDDFALWDSKLKEGQVLAIYSTPEVIAGYNAGKMNTLFTAFDTQSEGITITDSHLVWGYASGFEVLGRALGDTWLGADGKYYIWMDGASQNAAGMVGTVIPEPNAISMLLGPLVLLGMYARRQRKNRLH